MKFVKELFFCLAWVVSATSIHAQYHLAELGVAGGLGAALPLQSSSKSWHETGIALTSGSFYSHWVCGKSWGYQFDLGFNYASQRHVKSSEIKPLNPADAVPSARIHAVWLQTGVSFKVRQHNYHRPFEICWMLGPVIQTRLWSLAVLQLDQNSPKSYLAGRGDVFRVGGQVAMWIRFPMRKMLSWFLVPGIELLTPYQLRTALHPDSYRMEFWQPTLRAGFTVWNNR